MRAWASFTSAPANFSHIPNDRRNTSQLTHGSPISLAAGLNVPRKDVVIAHRHTLDNTLKDQIIWLA